MTKYTITKEDETFIEDDYHDLHTTDIFKNMRKNEVQFIVTMAVFIVILWLIIISVV